MHKIDLSCDIVARAGARRDRVHPFMRFDPAHTALLVVDMQNGFVDPALPISVPTAREIVPNIDRIATALRAAGGSVVWLKHSAGPEAVAGWGNWFENFMDADTRAALSEHLTEGAPGFELWPELVPQPADRIVVKTRFSAFLQGSSGLDRVLRGTGVDTLLIVGTVTNVCCESTARDAAMLNYKVIMVADANAARSDAEHNAALNSLFNVFADVLATDEVVERIEQAGLPAAAAAGATAE